MITVRDLQSYIDEALRETGTTLDSEVRFISGDKKDCSFETQWRGIRPGFAKGGVPMDRRYGDGTFHLAQEAELQDAPEQLLISFDWR
tara:strand:- start:41 stop:304 length:264 start_codon:yes stop_codon:yes gene_type:complete